MNTIDIEILCSNCNSEIGVEIEYLIIGGGKVRINVEPCQSCLKTERDFGYDEGYSKGYDNGNNNGYQTAKDEIDD